MVTFMAYDNWETPPCVYFLLRMNGFGVQQVVYVGQTVQKCLGGRIQGHKAQGHDQKVFDRVVYLEVAKEYLNQVELHFIDLFKPKYNKGLSRRRKERDVLDCMEALREQYGIELDGSETIADRGLHFAISDRMLECELAKMKQHSGTSEPLELDSVAT